MTLTQVTTGGVDENINIDSNTLKVDGTNNRVGIGTAAPNGLLTVQANSGRLLTFRNSTTGTGSSDGSYIALNGSDLQISNAESANTIFYTGDTERMRIDSSGFITQKFTSNNSSTPEGLFINNENNATGNNASLIFSNDSGNRKKIAIAAVDVGNYGASDLVFALDGADSGSVSLSSDEKMRIDSSGNVAIGTSTIGSGSLTLYGSGSRTMYQGSSTGTGDGNGFTTGNNGSTDAFLWNYENGFMQFATNNTERMRIDSSGRVGIGTTDPSSFYAGADQLVVSGGSGDGGITIDSGTSAIGRFLFADGTTGADRYRGYIAYSHSDNNLTVGTDGSERMRINNTGAVTKPTNPLLKSNMGNQYGSSGSLITSPATAILQASAEIDKGDNGWTTSGSNAYTFVCPVDGIYVVHAHTSLGSVTTGRAIWVMGYTAGGGNLPLANYVEVMDTEVTSHENYSYFNTWSFTAGTRVGFGINGGSGLMGNHSSQWGIYLLQ